MKIYTTYDCVKPTDFEKIILACIKGVLYDFKHSMPEPYCNEERVYSITVSTDGALTFFRVEGKTPRGLFDEIKRLLTPFTFGYTIQGGFDDMTERTSIILQRFELERETIICYKPHGIRNKQ
jgi:hypothetical protein